MSKKLSVVMLLSGALCASSILSAETLEDWPALTKDGKMVIPYAAAGTTPGTINFKYNVFTIGTNTLLKATTPRLMTLPKDATALCGTPIYWSDDDDSINFFGTRAGYVYTAKADYVECEGSTGFEENARSYFYAANISTGASCVYAVRMKTAPTATTYTTNVQVGSANEIADQNGDAIKDVMMTMWSPVSAYIGNVIIDPATCKELKSNTYSVGTL